MISTFSAITATAATFTVTNTNDSGAGSLRQAVLDSDAAPSSDTIVFDATFDSAKTITLAFTIIIDPTAGDSLTIIGPGPNLLTVSGNNAVLPFLLNGGDTASISGMTLTKGLQYNAAAAIDSRGTLSVTNIAFTSANTGASGGAALFSDYGTTATVTNCSFTSNLSAGASAIYNNGTLTVTNTSFASNSGTYGAIFNSGTMTLTGCTFTDNTANGGGSTSTGGGAIYSSTDGSGTVTIVDCKFTGNKTTVSQSGGAIVNRSGTMDITNSTFTNNRAAANGGGAISSGDILSVSGCTFTGNSTNGSTNSNASTGRGGAIFSFGRLTIANTMFTGNSATIDGGAIFYVASGPDPALTITDSTLANNIANSDRDYAGDGGAIYIRSEYAPNVFSRCTFSGNVARTNTVPLPDGPVSFGNGGGVYSQTQLTVDNCTISGNSAAASGGGIYDSYTGGGMSQFVIINSTLVGNSASSGGGIRSSDSVGDTPTSLGNTIVANNSGGNVANPILSQGFNLIGGDPKLGPLAENGGPTKTHALLPGSPAIDKGKSFGLTTDQRGLPRPFDNPSIPSANGGDGSDIGAYENQPPNTPIGNNVTTPAPAGNASATFSAVSRAGFTTFIPIDPSSAGAAPRGYTIVNNLPAYDITTTAGFSAPVQVCFTVSTNVSAADFARLRILHRENGKLVDRTILPPDSPAPNFATRTVCARVNSLSPFVLALAPVPPNTLGNISTRLRVETGDNALIGGFIVTGTEPKKVIVRAIGPSLPVAGKLANPTLELFGPSGKITSNDNWEESPDKQAIIDSTVPPSNPLESAIVATLPANATEYTAVVRGASGGTGIGLVEVYDLDGLVDSKLANISTRGLVQTGDNAMIGGFIITGTTSKKVIVRAIGPSLPVAGKLADPTLELFNANGQRIALNNNWRETQQAEIIASKVPPTSDLESAIVSTLPPGNTTAVVRGNGDTTGVALVEVYALE